MAKPSDSDLGGRDVQSYLEVHSSVASSSYMALITVPFEHFPMLNVLASQRCSEAE